MTDRFVMIARTLFRIGALLIGGVIALVAAVTFAFDALRFLLTRPLKTA